MGHKGHQPTMKDVAREAGVSLGTVSKVFNGIAVGESYKLRVEEAARRLGYQINSYARGFKTNKTLTVALVIPDLTNPYYALLSQHISTNLAKRGYRTLLFLTGGDPDKEQGCLGAAQRNQTDGIIGLLCSTYMQTGIPFVSLDRYLGTEIPCVTSDHFGGGQLAAEKLIELGCKSLAFVRIGSEVPVEMDKRRLGFEASCRTRQISFREFLLDDQAGDSQLRTFLETYIRNGKLEFDGVFSNTDILAVQLTRILKEHEISVPRDVQVIGFDGIRRFNSEDLFCSTIVQPIAQIAETAVDIVLREDPSTIPALTCLPVRYMAGGTTRE